ncbi:armadillo-type protein [Mycena albidolilacea]|uniref:Armadillo-type protein n=1 Tax=Mycena albidolilacea TaxID=1033008 RepID=A0AAD7EWA9_9AGAR|nr:armadillo-type protein [Mycena albidolilacea]
MPPLNRQDSRLSIYSRWSDSNSLLVYGPTINLHAASKPLMRLMYYRQASDILRKNRGSPLTTAILETYASYFPWDYVSWSTKTAILSELVDRADSEDEARAVVDSPVFPHIAPMLESPDPQARSCSCRLLRSLARYKSIAPAVLELEPYEQLVFLLDDKHSGVIREATAALTRLSRWVDGAKGVVDANALDHVLRLLESPNPDTRESASELVGRVARHESTAPAVLKLNPSVQLVSSLGNEFPEATYALSQITRWEDGAKAVVDAKALDHVLRLLQSPNLHIRAWACVLTANLAFHESTAPAIFKLNPSVQLVSLLGDTNYRATAALSRIARWVDGAKSVVDAKVLDHVLPLLESPHPDGRRWACDLVKELASHEATAPAILQLKPIPQLESLLQDPHPPIHDSAISALEAIRQWPDGVDSSYRL